MFSRVVLIDQLLATHSIYFSATKLNLIFENLRFVLLAFGQQYVYYTHKHETQDQIRLTLVEKDSGGHREGETPVPIPNTAVKPFLADGTWLLRARESRMPPGYFSLFKGESVALPFGFFNFNPINHLTCLEYSF